MKNRPKISDAELKVHKQLIRKQLLTARNNLVSQELEICNVKITKQLASLPEVQTAQTIMGYLAFGKEISIDGLLETFLQQNKNVCVPIIVDKEKSLLEAVYLPNLGSVVLGEFGIRMPMQVATCPTEDIDVVLVPGLGFSKNGARFYSLPENTNTITLLKQTQQVPTSIPFGAGEQLVPMRAGETVAWSVQY